MVDEKVIKKIYLDVCCLNRPFDDWRQDRIRLEGEAVLSIIEQVTLGKLQLISSEAIVVEIERMTNLIKKTNILKIMDSAMQSVKIGDEVELRSQQLEQLGFGLFDSYHLACAENAQVDIFLSTDDRLIKKAIYYRNVLKVEVCNPVIWLINTL